MLNKLKNKPLWYKIWALSVAAAAVYCLIKWAMGGLNKVDHWVNLYLWVSIIIDLLIHPGDKHKP